MSVKEDIHSQILGGLANTAFPINTPEDLLAAMPEDADTTVSQRITKYYR